MAETTLPARKQIRLACWDYSTKAYYHVTACTAGRTHLFGAVVNSSSAPYVALSETGRCVEDALGKALERYPSVSVDAYVIMPNHAHLLVGFSGKGVSLDRFVSFWKSHATREARRQQPGLQLWQRGYYERIVRNEADYHAVWDYIEMNPRRWSDDEYYSKRIGHGSVC